MNLVARRIARFHSGTFLLTLAALLFANGIHDQARSGAYPISETLEIPMGDGTELHLEIWYPQTGPGPWPVVLARTPYGAAASLPFEIFVSLGYVAIGQDIRGFGGSGGRFEMFRAEGWGPGHEDGYETLTWILSQPWCDGEIGTFGGSAVGITQNLLMGAVPPGLSCTYVHVAAPDLYNDLVFPGGTLREADIETWLDAVGYPALVDSIGAHAVKDEYWSWVDVNARTSLIPTPSYQVTGWYDLMVPGALTLFANLQYGGAPGALGNQKLIVGPWDHAVGGTTVGELSFPGGGIQPAETIVGSPVDWYDYWEKGASNGIMERPPVAYYLMGDIDAQGVPGNEWRAAWDWPPAATRRSYYLGSGGALSATSLSPGTESFVFDPANPVPTLGGANLVLQRGPYDQRPVESRPDVLLFETEPLAGALEVVGPVEVVLHVSSDRLDTDFTAKLTDVYPDGRSMLVCDGILRARFRDGFDVENQLTPGEVVQLRIDLGATAIVFAPGHRVRLAVSSSNSPRFSVNPNHGGPFGSGEASLVATNRVYMEASRLSYLVLPVTNADPSSVPVLIGSGIPTDLAPFGLFPGANPAHGPVRFGLSPLRPDGVSVDAMVFDTAGRLVRVLLPRGTTLDAAREVVWDGWDQDRGPVPAGVYLIRIRSGGYSTSFHSVLVR